MTTRKNQRMVVMAGVIFALGAGMVQAALAPRGPEELKKQSSHIVSGKVLEVTSKVQKSTVETSVGIHRDRIFTIKLLVKEVTKGAGVGAGEEIEVVAWQPAKRIPPVPGLQGHETIPKKGDTVVVYLKRNKAKVLEPILPNGIVVDDKA